MTLRQALACVVVVAALACARRPAGGELRAQKKMLEREVEGLRELAGQLERGDAMIPSGDVAVAIDETLVRDLVAAQLPFEADVDRYRVKLTAAEAIFRGNPQVRLRGTVALRENPEVYGELSVLGALEHMEIDEASGTLKASVGVDHLNIVKAGGLETLLGAPALEELARTLRLQVAAALPPLSIPVKVQQRIELPAVSHGPVRLDGASMPMQAGISRVLAGQGRLWIGIHFRPGDVVKNAEAPAAGKAGE